MRISSTKYFCFSGECQLQLCQLVLSYCNVHTQYLHHDYIMYHQTKFCNSETTSKCSHNPPVTLDGVSQQYRSNYIYWMDASTTVSSRLSYLNTSTQWLSTVDQPHTSGIALNMYVYNFLTVATRALIKNQNIGQHEYLNWDCGSQVCQPQKRP